MRVEARDVISGSCRKCGAPCVQRLVRIAWDTGDDMMIATVSCVRCGEKWLHVPETGCGREVLIWDIFSEG